MNLYFSPMACSLASRMALYEAGAQAQFTPVDLRRKRLPDGADYLKINPMGQVPALEMEDGAVLTENVAVLQYVAERFPAAGLAPRDTAERSRMQQWLAFISTELHKVVFAPLFDPEASEPAREYARGKLSRRMDLLEAHLADREYLLDAFSVADILLVTVLNWARGSGVELKPWPAVERYHGRVLQRPALARALAEELPMYREEQRHRAAAS